MVRIFELLIPSSEYDDIGDRYFNIVVKPMMDKPEYVNLSAAREEFKLLTERPSADSVKRTGLTPKGARQMLTWYEERDHITVGSTKDDVLRVQGTPDEITESMWRYGASRVSFSKDRVTGWNIWRGFPLKVRILPSAISKSNRRFSVRSTKDEVFFAQGPPNEFKERQWKYGASTVFFEDGRVTRWEQSPGELLRIQNS